MVRIADDRWLDEIALVRLLLTSQDDLAAALFGQLEVLQNVVELRLVDLRSVLGFGRERSDALRSVGRHGFDGLDKLLLKRVCNRRVDVES